MTNDEIQNKSKFRMTKRPDSYADGFCGLVILSPFVIRHSSFLFLAALCSCTLPLLRAASVPDYAAVSAIFNQHCLDCHAANEPEGQLVLESFDSLMKGGELGPAVLSGQSTNSLIVQMIEGRFEKEGKKKIM